MYTKVVMRHEDSYTDRLTRFKLNELQVHFDVICLSYVAYTRLKLMMTIYAYAFVTNHLFALVPILRQGFVSRIFLDFYCLYFVMASFITMYRNSG